MTALSVRQRGSRGGGSKRSKWLTIALFLVPALALYGLFVLLPIVQAAHYSLYKWNGLQPLTDFIGLKNYQVALSSDVFRAAIANNLFIVVAVAGDPDPVLACARGHAQPAVPRPGGVPAAVLPAVRAVRGRHRHRVPAAPAARTRSSTRRSTGVGLGTLVQDWLGDSNIVMLTMFVIISWKYFGFHMILMLAGLQGIPRELEEAALIDGADRGRRSGT